jgi:4'-phosphopantetheinyl transferase
MEFSPQVFVIKGISKCNINKVSIYQDKLYKKDAVQRLVYDSDKIRAIISEILIRSIYCSISKKVNDEIVFMKNEFGKPYIKNSEDFCFNISHSSDLVVCAIDHNEIGVDVEVIQKLDNGTLKIICTENEYSILRTKENIHEFGIAIWTQKEAYLKYLGTGLSKEVKSFDVINKKNIDKNVQLYTKIIDEYSLSLCIEKNIDFDKIITEISIDKLLSMYNGFRQKSYA